MPPTIPNGDNSSSNSNPVPPTDTPDADGAISDFNTIPITTSNTDRLPSASEPSSTPGANNSTSIDDPLLPTIPEADDTASDSNFVAPASGSRLFAQDDKSVFDGDDPLDDALTELDLPAAKANWECYCFPFDTLPVLRSHALPHFVLLNTGEKLVGMKLQRLAPVVTCVFKVNRIVAMESLATMYKTIENRPKQAP